MELGSIGITVNVVRPDTIVETGLRDEAESRSIEQSVPTAKRRKNLMSITRVGRPDDVARAVAILASDEPPYLTGQTINATGGLGMQ